MGRELCCIRAIWWDGEQRLEKEREEEWEKDPEGEHEGTYARAGITMVAETRERRREMAERVGIVGMIAGLAGWTRREWANEEMDGFLGERKKSMQERFAD